MSKEAHQAAQDAFAKEMAKTGHWSPRERIRRLTAEVKAYRLAAAYWRTRALAAEHGTESHTPHYDDGVIYCGWPSGDGVRDGCGHVWPCPTVRDRLAAPPEAPE